MKRTAILLASALGLTSCGQADDGYRFERKEFEHTQPAITIVTHPNIADLRAKAPASATQTEVRELMAWSVLRGKECEVHVVDPARSYQPIWIGHEVTHCVWGRFHK